MTVILSLTPGKLINSRSSNHVAASTLPARAALMMAVSVFQLQPCNVQLFPLLLCRVFPTWPVEYLLLFFAQPSLCYVFRVLHSLTFPSRLPKPFSMEFDTPHNGTRPSALTWPVP